MKDWLEDIKNQFPDKAIDISESLQLLKETINGTMDDINKKLNDAFIKRDFEAIERYTLLAKKTHGYENRIEEVIEQIGIESELEVDETDEETEKRAIPNYTDYVVDHNIEHTLYDDFTYKRPYAFRINAHQLVKVKTWQDMLIQTCEFLLVVDERKFLNFEYSKEMQGKKNKYFSVEPDKMRQPRKIGDKIYVETNQSANSIRNLIIKLLKAYNFKITEYKVFFRADYANLNKG